MRSKLVWVVIAVAAILASASAEPRRRGAHPVKPTYSRDVARIIQGNCESCHREGGNAPFSLSTYRDVLARARMVKQMTSTRQMPPWKPAPECGEYDGARVLTEGEIATIAAWVDQGSVEGDPSHLPPARSYTPGWALGPPDLTLSEREMWTPPSNEDTFRCFVMPEQFSEDTLISAIDFLPTARRLVHHAVAYVDTSGRSSEIDRNDPGPGYDYMKHGLGFDPYAIIGIWLPNADPLTMPEGVVAKIPKGSRIVLQVHYHPYQGRTEADRLYAGLYFPKTTPRKLLRFLSFAQPDFVLPPNARDIRVVGTHTLDEPIRVLTVGGHMHSIGRKIRIDATRPDGGYECLMKIDDWDPAWQGMYTFRRPPLLPKGTVFGLEGVYDNTMENPRQPNIPPREVRWGEPATEEMLIAYLTYVAENEDLSAAKLSKLPMVSGAKYVPMMSTGVAHSREGGPRNAASFCRVPGS